MREILRISLFIAFVHAKNIGDYQNLRVLPNTFAFTKYNSLL
ncbi:hypothetical protein HMPREF1429_00768 [Helicobacter pylori GAM93Bi]|nr:hypothetical protein HMPREF1429_00768 [Helicobacter pylori GAM93Bi]